MFEQIKPCTWMTGRILLSQIFLISGVMKFMNWAMFVGMMNAKGMPAPEFLLALAALTEIGGGLGVLLGCQARLSALALALFLVPATLVFHNFWAYEGEMMQNQMQHFLKNLAIMGGLYTIVAVGSGPFSIDNLWSRTSSRRERVREPMEAVLH